MKTSRFTIYWAALGLVFTSFFQLPAYAEPSDSGLHWTSGRLAQLQQTPQKVVKKPRSKSSPSLYDRVMSGATHFGTTHFKGTSGSANKSAQMSVQQQKAMESAAEMNNENAQTKKEEKALGIHLPGIPKVSRDRAFDEAVKSAIPMTPAQVLRMRQMFNANQKAAAQRFMTPPKPTTTSLFVNLSPGSVPPVIRLSQGFVTSLVFVDATGASWPIQAWDLGNPKAFNIVWDKRSNLLMVQSMKLFVYGNLVIRLKGLPTPVMLTLIPGQKVVDYRVDVRVPGLGPNAKPRLIALPNSANPALLDILNGMAPEGSQVLKVEGGEVQAWSYNDRLFVRTHLTLLSPGWIATMSSPDGTHAYEMQQTPLLLVARYGKPVQLRIKGL